MRDLSLHILDICQNSLEAKANNINITIGSDIKKGILNIVIEDDGSGIDEEFLKKIFDPFVTKRKTRNIGLGLSLFKQTAKIAEGDVSIKSIVNKGTTVIFHCDINHIDRLPLGDVSETIISIIFFKENIDIVFKIYSANGEFNFNTRDIRERIGEIALTDYNVTQWIKEYINEGIKSIFGGVLSEITS